MSEYDRRSKYPGILPYTLDELKDKWDKALDTDGKESLFENRYWRRAWVTQEITLARQATIVMTSGEVSFAQLMRICSVFLRRFILGWESTSFRAFVTTFDYGPSTLVELLEQFTDRECQLPHDRVFSLLSLCNPAESANWKVDYTISAVDLIYQVFELSRDIEPCLCAAAKIAQALGLTGTSLPPINPKDAHPWIRTTVEATTLSPEDPIHLQYLPGIDENYLEVDLRHVCQYFYMAPFWCKNKTQSAIWAAFQLDKGRNTSSNEVDLEIDELSVRKMSTNGVDLKIDNVSVIEKASIPSYAFTLCISLRLIAMVAWGPAWHCSFLQNQRDISFVSEVISVESGPTSFNTPVSGIIFTCR
jgi:hypothetical protein